MYKLYDSSVSRALLHYVWRIVLTVKQKLSRSSQAAQHLFPHLVLIHSCWIKKSISSSVSSKSRTSRCSFPMEFEPMMMNHPYHRPVLKLLKEVFCGTILFLLLRKEYVEALIVHSYMSRNAMHHQLRLLVLFCFYPDCWTQLSYAVPHISSFFFWQQLARAPFATRRRSS